MHACVLQRERGREWFYRERERKRGRDREEEGEGGVWEREREREREREHTCALASTHNIHSHRVGSSEAASMHARIQLCIYVHHSCSILSHLQKKERKKERDETSACVILFIRKSIIYVIMYINLCSTVPAWPLELQQQQLI